MTESVLSVNLLVFFLVVSTSAVIVYILKLAHEENQ
jgi:hypothetical protein